MFCENGKQICFPDHTYAGTEQTDPENVWSTELRSDKTKTHPDNERFSRWNQNRGVAVSYCWRNGNDQYNGCDFE